MRVRLKLDRLHDLMARSNLTQNHWAIRIGISRGHWSEIVNGKHVHPSPRTRERMLEVFGVAFDDLFEVEHAPGWSDPHFQAAVRGRYLIDEEIGQGGSGTVYLARDVRLGRRVAIKVLSPEAITGIGTAQFLKEIRYTARLEHPNILPLHDAGEAAGYPYYVMPFVRGGSLRALLNAAGRLSLDRALGIVRGIGRALAHAHANHVLHCDVKPENILLSDDHVYVADFGIARAIHAEFSEWAPRVDLDSSAGTPAYVSPEQASGEPNLDARSDVYSLACVLFEMLAGRPPFVGRNAREIVAQRFTSEMPDVRAFAPELPAGLSGALQRGMALVPERRTGAPRALIEQVDAAREPQWFARWARGMRYALARAAAPLPRPTRASRLLGGMMDGWLQDIRQAMRTLRRAPGFLAVAMSTLALGIGANTAIFAVVNGTLLRSLPYDDAHQLTMIWQTDRASQDGIGDREWTVPPADYVTWRDRTGAFQDLAAFNIWWPILSGDGPAQLLVGSLVAPNFFPLLGATPAVGRAFTPEHAQPGNHRVVVMSHGFWRRRFGGDSSVVGRTIVLNGDGYTILGVMEPDFRHPEPDQLAQPDVWAPLAWTDPLRQHGGFLRVIGRLRAGLDVTAAQGDLAGIARQLESEWPATNTRMGVVVRSLREELFGNVRSALLILLVAAGFVMVIVCANVGNLVLARGHGRRKEFALRTALGAGRSRLARQLITENLVVALGGAALGIGVVHLGLGYLRAVQDRYLSSVVNVAIDLRVVAFTAVLALAAGILFGLMPAIGASRRDLRTPLIEDGTGSTQTGRSRWVRNGLVVAEVTLATIMVVGAGLLGRSFAALIRAPIGFERDGVVTANLTLPRDRYAAPDAIQSFVDGWMATIGGLPGVQGAALVSDLPFTTENRSGRFNPVDALRPPGEEPSFEYRTVSPGYFLVLGMAIQRGRDFSAADGTDGVIPLIVNEALASRLWPAGGAVGRSVQLGDGVASRVIGVVADALDDGFDSRPEPRFYRPFAMRPSRGTYVVVRSLGDLDVLGTALERETRAIDPDVLVADIRPLRDVVAETVGDDRMALRLAGTFSALALILAGVGIFGVMSYMVGQRRREIGIRSALGARRADVMALILRQSAALVGIGTAIGLLLAVPLTGMLRAFLYGIAQLDPVAFAGAPIVLGGVALLAGYLPATRASRISPSEALTNR